MQKNMRGQGLIEFALVLPILLVLVIGILDFGAAFFVKVQLENSAREGANYMVFNTADGKASGFALTKTAVQTEGANAGITINAADIAVSCLVGATVNNDCPSGSTVVVSARYTMPLAVDIFSNGPLQLVGDARMQVP